MGLSIGGISAVADIVFKVIDKVIPDPAAKAQAQLALLELAQKGELAQLEAETTLAQGQIELNKAEAGAEDLFTRGWRPFIGWICGVGLATQFLVGPLATWVSQLFGATITFPELDMETLLTLLLGMLGLGALRTVEKVRGKS